MCRDDTLHIVFSTIFSVIKIVRIRSQPSRADDAKVAAEIAHKLRFPGHIQLLRLKQVELRFLSYLIFSYLTEI